jgi:hypothetical protein
MYFDPSLTILTGVDKATAQQWLAMAQKAYGELLMGGKVVSAAYEGKSVSYYEPRDMAQLLNFIFLLQRYLGLSGPRNALVPWYR